MDTAPGERKMRLILVLMVVLVQAACAPRGPIVVLPETAAIGSQQTIFAASNRAPDETGQPGAGRARTMEYYRIDTVVPPDRQPGDLAMPGYGTDPRRHFAATGIDRYAGTEQFRHKLREMLIKRPRGQREVIVFVHGFNTTFAEGVMRLSQLTYDLRTPAVPVVFSWPSAGFALGYEYDDESTIFARNGLEELLLSLQDVGAERILLAGHSMGAFLAMETMRQMAIARPGSLRREIGGVILMAPDIDLDVFRQQAERIGDLPQPFVVVVSARDRALRISAQLSGQESRLGNLRDVSELGDLDLTVVNVTGLSSGLGHTTPVSSPTLIALANQLGDLDDALQAGPSGRLGLGSATVLTIQNATEIILTPATEILR